MKICFYYFLQIKWKNHNKQQKCYHESLKMSNFYFHFYVKSSESMTFSAAKFWEREKTCTQEKKLRKNISITCLEEWVRKKICVINDSSSEEGLESKKKLWELGKRFCLFDTRSRFLRNTMMHRTKSFVKLCKYISYNLFEIFHEIIVF